MMLTTWRGRETRALELIEATLREPGARRLVESRDLCQHHALQQLLVDHDAGA